MAVREQSVLALPIIVIAAITLVAQAGLERKSPKKAKEYRQAFTWVWGALILLPVAYFLLLFMSTTQVIQLPPEVPRDLYEFN